jgi:hypothetical protein
LAPRWRQARGADPGAELGCDERWETITIIDGMRSCLNTISHAATAALQARPVL